MVANKYAEAGKWDKAAHVRISINNRGLKKMAGESLIEERGSIHRFFSGEDDQVDCEEGDNLVKIFPDMGIEIGGLRIGGRVCFVIIVGLIILPTVWLRNMSILSYISATGVLASVILLGSILWAGKFDGIGFQERGTLLNWKGLPTAVSLYRFCYGAHAVFPTLYTSMKNQRLSSKVKEGL
ncbi:unnamed protein product [Ilex paraguariensis]|uniref:Amino acid transporter transmembrane domain-containing protein n=1 Tax=Ilex paraguariensis TaxID=185542 RepID=A0ABC8T0E9_9AQUA